MMQPSPLNDPAMYLKLAQAAAARGNLPAATSGNIQAAPPGQPQPPSPPGMPAPGGPPLAEKIPPQIIQMFAQGLQQIIPNLQPPQLQAVIQLFSKACAMASQAEPPGV